MIDTIVGPYSILPYVGLASTDGSTRATAKRVARSIRPWAYAMTLLVCGVSIARSARIANGMEAPSVMAPVVVNAPDAAEWKLVLRSDTLARMLIKKHVDSATAKVWALDFARYAEQTHVNPRLLIAIAYAESEFNPGARSNAGAIGLMQVLPVRAWWREYEPRCGRMSARSLHDPSTNICFGAHIYKEFLTRHNGDTDRALAAYNNGSGELNGYPDRVYASLAVLRR